MVMLSCPSTRLRPRRGTRIGDILDSGVNLESGETTAQHADLG